MNPGDRSCWATLRRRPSPPWVRLIVSGSQDITDRDWLTGRLRTWWNATFPKGSLLWDVWHGDTQGPERILGGFLAAQGQTVQPWGACWNVHEAGSERTEAMLTRAHLEYVDGGPTPYLVAFPGEDARATWHAVGLAAKMSQKWTPWEAGMHLVVIPAATEGLLEVCGECLRVCCLRGEGPCGLHGRGTSWLTKHILKELRLEPSRFWRVAA